MPTRRAEPLTQSLLHETVLSDWFEPMEHALSKVRYSDAIFYSLPMKSFALLGGLRQLLSISTLREQVQTLFHWDVTAERLPVPRSTWSDAMASGTRAHILRQAIDQLVLSARTHSVDKLSAVPGIQDRPILAIDATYQEESSHYNRVIPAEGGEDNPKGHLLLTYYDLRYGLPLSVTTQTQSMGEMRVLKQGHAPGTDWSQVKKAIYVVDRAFIDGRYWDQKKTKHKATVITRMKSTLAYTSIEAREIAPCVCNEKVLSDTVIALKSSKELWRLIQWKSPEGTVYQYLSNDLSLEPGVIAFLYYRRWDEEKFFDNFKHDLAHAKAWGKSPKAIEQQALLGIMAYVLSQLFLYRSCDMLNVSDQTQARKQRRKVEQYLEHKSEGEIDPEDVMDEEGEPKPVIEYDAYRAYYTQLSRITRQVWRFLKNCFSKKSSPELYQRQLRPLLLKYL